MFIHNLDPVLVSIGPLSIRYYSLAYIIGFLLSYWWLKKSSDSKEIKGLDQEKLDTLLVYLMIGTVAGGRFFYFIFYNIRELLSNPLELFMIWHGGMSFHGGLLGVLIATYMFSKKYNIKLMDLADALAVPAALALSLGRVANFINAEIVGTVTNVAWCVNFNNELNALGERVCRHPVQLYEGIKTFIVFLILLLLRKIKNRPKGLIIWSFVLLYGILRFVINFWRDQEPFLFLNVTTGQFLSISMAVLAIIAIVKLLRDKNK